VGYVLLHRRTLYENAEYQLVQSNMSYLTPIWSNAQWELFAVRAPVPIAGRPDRMVDADQNELVIDVPHAATVGLRVRWSSVLDADASPGVQANVRPDGRGWTLLHVSAPGQVTVTG
jgi:hypothetical protein